jgi:hypothetical protein
MRTITAAIKAGEMLGDCKPEHRAVAMKYLDLTIQTSVRDNVSMKAVMTAYSVGFQRACSNRHNQKLRGTV